MNDTLFRSVDSITFHFNAYQVDDFIIKAAELEKEGYKLVNFEADDISYSVLAAPKSPYHATFHK